MIVRKTSAIGPSKIVETQWRAHPHSLLVEGMAHAALERMRLAADVRIAEEQRRGRARYHSAMRSIGQQFRRLREELAKGKA